MKNRIPWGQETFIKDEKLSREQFEENYGICHDCGAKFGENHEYGCDMEECPACHSQFMGCEEKCLKKIKNNGELLARYRKNAKETGNGMGIFFDRDGNARVEPYWNKKDEKLDAYLPSLDYVAPMLSDVRGAVLRHDKHDEYVKPFFPCDPYSVKKSKKEGKYILPGGEYCL